MDFRGLLEKPETLLDVLARVLSINDNRYSAGEVAHFHTETLQATGEVARFHTETLQATSLRGEVARFHTETLQATFLRA
ncbi:MAG: hypothetical protein ACRD24_07455 [Terriglobales bacterium]